MLTFDLFTSKVEFASPFVWAIYIYIESMEVTCRSTVVKIVLIGNLRWPSSGLYLLYFPANFHIDPSVEMWLIVYSNDHAPLTVRPIYSSSKLRTAQIKIFSLVAMIGLEKCCIKSACLQWLCHSGERTVARGLLVLFPKAIFLFYFIETYHKQLWSLQHCLRPQAYTWADIHFQRYCNGLNDPKGNYNLLYAQVRGNVLPPSYDLFTFASNINKRQLVHAPCHQDLSSQNNSYWLPDTAGLAMSTRLCLS